MNLTRADQLLDAYDDAIGRLAEFERRRCGFRLLLIGPVQLEILRRAGTQVSIEYLGVERDSAGAGLGSVVLQAACDFADEHGWTLTVNPVSLSVDTTMPRLCRLFERHGFRHVAERGSRRRLAGSPMRRPPHQPSRQITCS